MSRFYASIQGNRGEATRAGTPNSGIDGHIRGWDVGIRVEGFVDVSDGSDRFRIFVTGGSNGNSHERLIGEYGAVIPDTMIAREVTP